MDATTTWTPASKEGGTSDTASDDLTLIKGIGPAIAKKLDELGVKTFGDLVQANPEELATQIAKKSVTAAHVREWIAEGKKNTRDKDDAVGQN